MLQNYQETYMNFLGNFLKVFWTKKKCKKIINSNKNKKKRFNYFSEALAQKNITKMLKKISRTH
jgi:hypothetical protein